MKRGIAVIVLFVGAALASCKGSDGAKKRVPDGEKASAAFLIRTIDAVRDADDGVLLLAEGVSEVCGKGCQCLAVAVSAEAGSKAGALYGCPSLCTEDARKQALAAAPGQQLATLAGACTPAGIGLTADTVPQVGDDWLAAFVSGQYFADAYDAANADDRKAYETAFATFSVPLAPTAGMAGVSVPGTTNLGALGRSRAFVAIDAKGGLRAGSMHAVRFTSRGAEYVPATIKTLTDAKQIVDGTLAKKPPSDAPLPQEDPPPPEDEPAEDEDDLPGGTGTAMALEEGKMGKKDSDRAQGQYKMKSNNVDPQLARQQAIDQARSAGILGTIGDTQGGAFASLTGTGDLSSGFDQAGAELDVGVIGVASTPIRDQIIVIADREAPAMKVLEVLGVLTEGAVLATEHRGRLAAFPLVFASHGSRFAPPPWDDGQVAQLFVDVGSDTIRVSNTLLDDVTEVKAADAPALEAAIAAHFKEAMFADRRDLRVGIDEDTKVAQLVAALDASMSAGASTVKLGSARSIGTGYGTANGGGIGRSAASVPQVSIGQPNAVGDLDKAIIRRYIKRNIPKITYCYEKQLLVKPDIKGTVSTQFFISPSGEVAASNASGVDPEVASCVANVIRAIVFPKPKGGGGVQVNYPFTFRPAGG